MTGVANDTSRRKTLSYIVRYAYFALADRAFRQYKSIVIKLLTKEIISNFEKHPFGSQDGKGLDASALVMYFNLCGIGT